MASQTQIDQAANDDREDAPVPLRRFRAALMLNLALLLAACLLFLCEVMDRRGVWPIMPGMPLLSIQLVIGFGVGWGMMLPCWSHMTRKMEWAIFLLPIFSLAIQIVGLVIALRLGGSWI